VKTLHEHQIGTVGVEPVDPIPRLGRIRKGMALIDFRHLSAPVPIPSRLLTSFFHTGFVATFPASDFTSTLSSSLILGGSAIVYIANVRAAAKVTYLALSKDEETKSRTPSPMELDIFSFDNVDDGDHSLGHGTWTFEGHDADDDGNTDVFDFGQEDVKITFSFISSMAWIEVGSQVLAMPGAPMATSSSSLRGATGSMGLKGYVGRICQVLDR
jgi:hypothetical protein